MTRITGYAEGLLAIARAEGASEAVANDLVTVSQAVAANEDLRRTLNDASIPVATRQQVVEDLLRGKSHPISAALVSMVVGAGRSDELSEIAHAVAEQAAADKGRALAEIRTAVPLTDAQREGLVTALARHAGGPVELKVVIDPTVLGGVVAQIGDTVIDGSVRTRLTQMREALN